jgi:hypothetical protein
MMLGGLESEALQKEQRHNSNNFLSVAGALVQSDWRDRGEGILFGWQARGGGGGGKRMREKKVLTQTILNQFRMPGWAMAASAARRQKGREIGRRSAI